MDFRLLPIFAFWLLAVGSAWGQLAVGKGEWGFDGKVVTNSFNVFSVEVRNTSAQAFDGEVVLDNGGPFGRSDDAPYKQTVYLTPGAARILQFYPYIAYSGSSWRLSWGGSRRNEVEVPEAKTGPPAVVLFGDPQSPMLRSVKLPVFNETTFPPTYSATDGLHAAVLDHQPRWDAARRDAFLDWLKAGGIVHLCVAPDGTLPQFTEEFAVLNIPAANGRVGMGTVVKHPVPRSEISLEALEKAGWPAPAAPGNDERYYGMSPDSSLFSSMADATRPDIAWSLIYLLTAVYVILIGPVFYLIRKRDYRFVLFGFLATVALFAWVFTVVGRRGYGEKQLYHYVSIARSVGQDRWDVQHWVHPFATSGDSYRFAYPGAGQLFAAVSSQGDTVRGEVVQDKDGRFFRADIPLFSSRPFMHRGVLTGPNHGLSVTDHERNPGNTHLLKIVLKGNPEFLKDFVTGAVLYRENYHALTAGADGLELKKSGSPNGKAKNVFGGDDDYPDFGWRQRRTGSAETLLKQSATRLVKLATGESENSGFSAKYKLRKDAIRVLLFMRAPKSFEMQSEAFQAGVGYTLYVVDLQLPAGANP